MNINFRKLLPLVILTTIFTAAVFFMDARAESDIFPVPSVIEPNVPSGQKLLPNTHPIVVSSMIAVG